jgi:hypothetical protein
MGVPLADKARFGYPLSVHGFEDVFWQITIPPMLPAAPPVGPKVIFRSEISQGFTARLGVEDGELVDEEIEDDATPGVDERHAEAITQSNATAAAGRAARTRRIKRSPVIGEAPR